MKWKISTLNVFKKNKKRNIIFAIIISLLAIVVISLSIYYFLTPQKETEKLTGGDLKPGQFTITQENLDNRQVEINGKTYIISLENEKYYLNFPAESNLDVNTYVHPYFGKFTVINNTITLPNNIIIENDGNKVINVVNSRFNLPSFKVFILNAGTSLG